MNLTEEARPRALVTGAVSGIGRAAAVALSAAGWRVALADVAHEALEELRAQLPETASALAVPVDIAEESDVERLFSAIHAKWGGLDAVVHSAGIMRAQQVDIRDVDIDVWNRVLSVNLTGSFLVAKHAARLMVPAGSGVIVLLASGGGVIGPSGSLPYGASKGGVHGFGMTLEKQLQPHGIRVITLCPSAVDTPMIQRSLDEGVLAGGSAEAAESTRSQLVDPAGIGDLITLMVSPGARYLRGTVHTR